MRAHVIHTVYKNDIILHFTVEKVIFLFRLKIFIFLRKRLISGVISYVKNFVELTICVPVHMYFSLSHL